MSYEFIARKAFSRLIAWKTSINRLPLFTIGARQVGKTSILKHFGETHFRKTHYINFESNSAYGLVFEKDLEPTRILSELSALLKEEIKLDEDLLIFDEIQACPKAITSLKYFAELLQKLAICAAGSLLGVTLSKEPFPVGKVDYLYLFPLSFSEFLLALDDQRMHDFYTKIELEDLKTGISPAMKQQLWNYFLQFLVVGGMPAVVKKYIEIKDEDMSLNKITHFQEIRKLQSNIITTYESDFAKHCGKINAMHITRTFQSAGTQISQVLDNSTQKFTFKEAGAGVGYRSLAGPIDWLVNARLIHKLKIIENIEHPLEAFTKENVFKIFVIDIGILGAMMNLDPAVLLQMEFGTYKGYIAEQFVAQELIAAEHSKVHQNTFYSWAKNSSELEFVANSKFGIVPIEVKSGVRVSAKSLSQFEKRYQPKISIVLGGRGEGVSRDGGRVYVPIFMAEQLWGLLR